MTTGLRTTVVAVMLLASGVSTEAQHQGKVYRVGYLGDRGSPNAEALSRGLRDLSYVEGENITIEYRLSRGNIDRLPGLAAELVRRKVDIIFAAGAPAGRAAKNATHTIPIIFIGSTDLVAGGLVASLARPGGNITGFSTGAPGLYGKRLEIIKETDSRITRVGVLWNPSDPSIVLFKEMRAAGQELGVQVQSLEARNLSDIDAAFESATKTQMGALVVAQQAPINTNPKRIIELAAKRRLPAIYAETDWVDAGGLMSYGPSYTDLYRRAAIYVDKILKGAHPLTCPCNSQLSTNLKSILRRPRLSA